MSSHSRMLLLCLLVLSPGASLAQVRPNFVVVLTDDQGYGDLACYGNPDLKTPNLDKFASEGLRLTSCYSGHAVCSPARAAILTGRTPIRVGIGDWIPEESPVHLRRSEITIAKLLQQAGYATCLVGKWHLNGHFNRPTQTQPSDHGFDYWFATHNNALPNHKDPNNFVRNGEAVGELKGYAAPIVADEGIHWLKDVRDKSKPFLLFVCFHEPHEPIATDPKFASLYPSNDPSYSAHHGNISQMDDAFGRLMTTLDEQNLRENTFVFFTSDNGPAITKFHPHGSAGIFRDKKGFLHEGGIRVPGIVRWPGKTREGSVSDEPVSGVDLLPTICDIVDIEVPSDRVIDGASFLPVLSQQSIKRQSPLFWYYYQVFGGPHVAMRIGDWKILARVEPAPNPRTNDITEENQRAVKESRLVEFFLYNLKEDPSEKHDLARKEPEQLARLKAELEKKFREVQAEAPVWPTWKYYDVEGKKIKRVRYPRQ